MLITRHHGSKGAVGLLVHLQLVVLLKHLIVDVEAIQHVGQLPFHQLGVNFTFAGALRPLYVLLFTGCLGDSCTFTPTTASITFGG